MWLKVILFAFPMLGLHPCHVYDDYKKVIENLWKQYDQHTFYAVGEIGIDLYWDKTFHKEQTDAFKRQIALAKEVNLPFVIHSSDALDHHHFNCTRNARWLSSWYIPLFQW
jgi:TatD DNase family protein